MKDEVVKVLVPSYKRANNVKTTKCVAHCSLVVPVSQVADYEKHNPGVEVIGCPDEIKGISNTRQWCYDTFKNIFMLDDDIAHVTRAYNPGQYDAIRYQNPDIIESDKVDPETAYEVIQSLASLAKELGCYLFGFTSAVTPRDVRPFVPFTSNVYVKGTTMGLLEGSKLYFPEEPAGQQCEDHFVTLLNAFHHRYSIVDNRFIFSHVGTFKTVGGCAEYRTSGNEEDSYRYLKTKFGAAVQLKGVGTTMAGKAMQRTHAWERVLDIPY